MQRELGEERSILITSGSRDGPSKLVSTYLIKSMLSPMTLPLCSNDGNWSIFYISIANLWVQSRRNWVWCRNATEHEYMQMMLLFRIINRVNRDKYLVFGIYFFLIPNRFICKLYTNKFDLILQALAIKIQNLMKFSQIRKGKTEKWWWRRKMSQYTL